MNFFLVTPKSLFWIAGDIGPWDKEVAVLHPEVLERAQS